jgi:mRNA-degrading endonuclease RelE of RelBE toxin-antitoxin system
LPCKIIYSETVQRILKKALRKNSPLKEALNKKLVQIAGNPEHFKPLHAPLANRRRVHILGPFVLTYEFDKVQNIVSLLDFDHHDKIY